MYMYVVLLTVCSTGRQADWTSNPGARSKSAITSHLRPHSVTPATRPHSVAPAGRSHNLTPSIRPHSVTPGRSSYTSAKGGITLVVLIPGGYIPSAHIISIAKR